VSGAQQDPQPGEPGPVTEAEREGWRSWVRRELDRPCGTCGGDHWTRDHDDHVAVDRAYESADAPDRD
jgi:hypothetical protein